MLYDFPCDNIVDSGVGRGIRVVINYRPAPTEIDYFFLKLKYEFFTSPAFWRDLIIKSPTSI